MADFKKYTKVLLGHLINWSQDEIQIYNTHIHTYTDTYIMLHILAIIL